MAAGPAVSCLADNGTVLSVSPCLSADAFETGLANHPDTEFVSYIVNTCKYGVDIGYEGDRSSQVCKNWPSVEKYADAVEQNIHKDLSLGRKLGPFAAPPFRNFVGSPMGAFEKRSSSKIRIIHDLSWPQDGTSINAHISPEQFSMSYMSVDDVVQQIRQTGQHTLLAKLDLADAFHHVMVRPVDWELLGSSYQRSPDDPPEYYVSTVLPFGLRSSPKLFTDFAHATKLIMLYKGASMVEHYLDDFITLGPPDSSVCQDNLDLMLETCSQVGFAVNPNKVKGPSTVLEFLGIIIDTDLMELRISDERLHSILEELQLWHGRKRGKKRDILSLIGKLIFISKVVRSGRSFVRRLIEVSKKVANLNHSVKLNRQFQADIEWWLAFLPSWNGIGMWYESDWTASVDIELYTDASNIAMAGYYRGAWFVELVGDRKESINWREMYAVVQAAATWGAQWSGKRILFHVDNMSVVHILQSGTSKSPAMMDLVRALLFIAAFYQFEFSSAYINTHDNVIADSLSRLDFHKFWRLVPAADSCMTQPQLDTWYKRMSPFLRSLL